MKAHPIQSSIISLLGAALITLTACKTDAQTLHVGTAEWIPWQIVQGTTLTGITADVIREIENRSAITFKIEILPHNRVMRKFELLKIDTEPTCNPAWRKDQEAISVYSSPFYSTQDVVLVRKESGIKGTGVDDFEGLSLGCGLGYYYPEGFQEAFQAGKIIREDNRVSENNLMKLAFKRIDGVIMDSTQAEYLFRKYKLNRDDYAIGYKFSPSNLCFRLHISKKNHLTALNAAIESMCADGTVEKIIRKYIQ